MLFKDKILVCCNCGAEFALTSKEQEFFVKKGFQYFPKKCKSCRKNKREDHRQAFAFGNIENGIPPSDK